MEFGLQFFPDVGPDKMSAQQYWNECLDLVGICDELGYTQIRTIEHYFEPYGGYSPAPHIFLTAAFVAWRRARIASAYRRAGLALLEDAQTSRDLTITLKRVALAGNFRTILIHQSGGQRHQIFRLVAK